MSSVVLGLQNSSVGKIISKYGDDIKSIAMSIAPIALLVLGCVGLHYSLLDGSSLPAWREGLEYGVSGAAVLGSCIVASIVTKTLFPSYFGKEDANK